MTSAVKEVKREPQSRTCTRASSNEGQFVARAITAQHPFDSGCCIDDQTRRNVFDLLTGGLSKVFRGPLADGKQVAKYVSSCSSAAWKCKSLEQKTLNSSGNELTMSEISRGFLQGPFEDVESVRSVLEVSEFCASRRFLVVQGTPENPKNRPIDE